MKKNAIVGQSGGPTAAINATLSGVIRGCLSSEKIETVFGMKNGIEGFLNEDFCVLNDLFKAEADFVKLEKTPAAALGSCRKKLPSPNTDKIDEISIYNKVFSILERYDIGYFFYIGGNDSMDTIRKLSAFAYRICSEIKFVGVPKTIDNDLVSTDHTPGYGSAAKFIATTVSEIMMDTAVYKTKAVTIVEIMGRDAGWLTASAGLPSLLGLPAPDLVYLPEVSFSLEAFINDIKSLFEKKPNLVVAISEGIRYENGKYISEDDSIVRTDAFGHKALGGAGRTLENYLRDTLGCKARCVEISLLQRCAAHLASATDISESIRIGKFAVESALEGRTACMVSLKRNASSEYSVTLETVDVNSVANAVRAVPRDFINESGNYVTKECLEWILPLIQGESITDFSSGLPNHFII